jgi:hypothetical protein
MQILQGSKREITLKEWDEQIIKAKERLDKSKKCHELFGDCAEWIAEDERKLKELEMRKRQAIAYMDEHDIK